MNIAIFTNNYLPNPYGVSMSIESFRKEFEKRGHAVYIFAPETKGYVDVNPNAYRYPSIDINYKISFPLGIPYSRKISKKLAELEIDVIHSQHPNLIGWAAKRWAKKKNVPLVFTWHTLYDQYAHFVPIIPQKIVSWWTIGNARRYADSADQVIVPTPSVIESIRRWGVKNKNILAIPTGVEEENFADADREMLRKKYGVANDEILLLLVSRLTAEKNINFLFKSILPLLQKNEKFKFLVVGEGHELYSLKEKVSIAGLESRVFFAGVIPAADIKNYYASADIFVHASKSETQGMILTEAMYAGLPIVSVSATGSRNIITNHVTGFLVKENSKDFSDAVLILAGDAELRRRFSENSKKIAHEKYTASVCAQKMLEVYEKNIKTKLL